MKAWNLPQGFSDTLPPDAWEQESMRRNVLDEFKKQNYALVSAPMIEFATSLLSGSGADLSLQTYKFTDSQSLQQMVLRSDITPQMARIDANRLAGNKINKLCYCGNIIHTTINDFNSKRDPLQIGAEYFGNPTIDADLEIVNLAISTLKITKIKTIHLDLGHIAIAKELIPSALHKSTKLMDAIHNKDSRLIEKLTDKKTNVNLQQLIKLYGDVNILSDAKKIFKNNENIQNYLQQLETVYNKTMQNNKDHNISISFDLSEIMGFSYKTGLLFAAFTDNYGKEILRGGRYDNIGAVFGSSRPATGFSADLKTLFNIQVKNNGK
ncbi:MAG: ATP phosphoribosyltransferase regulatory subunit [Gammaproteobacteria bacterium]|nr:MAG: ATP phosphoribosyltransferase regulatory subunit [Gammaproteobacteria bacterium]